VALVESDSGSAFAALLRQREDVQGWLDGPVKKVTLTAIERQVEEQESGGDLASG
jgi:hypothetical protein